MRRIALSVGLIWTLGSAAQADILITANGGRYEGTITQDRDGYVLVMSNGDRITFAKGMVAEVKRSEPVTPAVRGEPAAPPASPTGPSTRSVDSGGEKKDSTPEPGTMGVVATGIGENPDKAIQAAFSQAIEQAVGVFVDADTLIKSDQIVRERILTFSRGFVREYKVIRQWQQDGLSYAQIRASVEAAKLSETLKANKIAMREVSGDLLARHIDFDVKNEADAAEMLKKALSDFDMIKLTKVEIVGKPTIARDGAGASMQIRACVSPDRDQWNKFSQDVRLILTKVATRRAVVKMEHRRRKYGWEGANIAFPKRQQLESQLAGHGVLVTLFKNMSIGGDQTQWDSYRVPEPLGSVVKAAATRAPGYRVVYVLLDDRGQEIARTTEPFVTYPGGSYRLGAGISGASWARFDDQDSWCVGPIWCNHASFPFFDECVSVVEMTASVVVSSQDLSRVAKAAVFLEEDTE